MTYEPKLAPYEHQREALSRMDGRAAFALLMAMRTGKTKTVLDDFGRLWDRGIVADLMVVAPAGVYRTWVKAMEDHLGPPLEESLNRTVWSAADKGKGADKSLTRFLGSMAASDAPRALLINTEALSSVERARDLASTFVAQRPTYVAVDESTAIKNPGASRTKFMVKAIGPRARVRRILSGLVAPQSPLDLFSQFQFLDPRILGFTSFYAFRARYAILKRQVFGGRAFDMVVGYRDEDELAERIAPHSYRVRLEDCHDVMDDLYVTREVELTPEQRRAYSELKEFATTALSAEVHVTATIALTQVLRLHQVLCGHVKDESGQVHEVPENRTKELVALLEDYDGKAIVWCSYDADVRRVVSVLEREHGKGSVARFWGGNIATREDEERQFLSDPNCRFMVATPSAGGKGRTWLVADLVVYYSNTSNLEHRLQSEERPKGVGKSTPITYVDLIAPGTVDGKILKALRAKIDVASTLQGDGWREWVV